MVSDPTTGSDGSALPDASVPGAADIELWIASLTDPSLSDADRIGRIRLLEELKSRAAAAQARLSVDFDASQRARHADLEVPTDQRGRGVASEIAAARRESPFRGAQHLGLAKVLIGEMPHTFAAFELGLLSEQRATILARETACLTLEDRRTVDAELLSDPSKVDGWGDRRLAAEAMKVAYRLDPQAAVNRISKAASERRVTVRPAPGTMSNVTALVPVAQGVAVFANLSRTADQLIGQGDGRTRGQIMADTLVERVTGQSSAAAVPVAVGLTASDDTLFAAGSEPAYVDGYGPVPAGVARDLVATAVAESLATLRRLYVSPETGQLVAMDSRARIFPAGLALFIDLRDQSCRTPWCDAPVRQRDHVITWAAGGETTKLNGQGLCEQCNRAKQAPDWRATPSSGPPGTAHTVTTTTPAGQTLVSTSPDLPRPAVHRRRYSPAEISFSRLVLVA